MIENPNTSLGQLADMLATGLTIRGWVLIPSAWQWDCDLYPHGLLKQGTLHKILLNLSGKGIWVVTEPVSTLPTFIDFSD